MTDLEMDVLLSLLMLEITPDEADLLLAAATEKPLPGQGKAEDGQAPPAAR
jgi:hypothetical protein